MRMPPLVLGLIVMVGIASLCPGAEVARRAPSAVKRSRTRQLKPVLRGCWRKRLCSRNVWTPRGVWVGLDRGCWAGLGTHSCRRKIKER